MTSTSTATTTDDLIDLTPADRTYSVRNVRAVLADTIVENATVTVDDGVIVDVREGGPTAESVVDGHNMLLIPGIVDSHSDGLEKEAQPRRNSEFPLDYALTAFEARLRSVGITTVFHGISYQEKERTGRSVAKAREFNEVISHRGASGVSPVDHRVLYRFDARDQHALDPLLEDLDSGALGATPLISFEDHTPGQGQYRDRTQFERAIDPAEIPEGMTAADVVSKIIEEAEALADTRNYNLDRLSPRAKAGEFILLAHDPEDGEDVTISNEAGASIAEFPVTLEAAQVARELGMMNVAGAPNALRGSSHNGNSSARDLVAAGVCDVLSSDYLPPAMLAAAFVLVEQDCCSLPDAIALITSGPARMAGLSDRGRLEPGRRGDLVLIDDRGLWPVVAGVRRALDTATLRAFG